LLKVHVNAGTVRVDYVKFCKASGIAGA
jgi:hypothetical protein